jgi:hypothetical protein
VRVLSSAGYALSISNYWAIINGSYTDYISGRNLQPLSGVTLGTDRLGKDTQGAFQTYGSSTSYVTAPAGNYFSSGSFTITVWVNWMFNSGTLMQPLFDFNSAFGTDDIYFQINQAGSCPTSNSWAQIFGGAAGTTCATVCPTSEMFTTTGVWTHLTLAYDSASQWACIYKNGNLAVCSFVGQVRNVSRVNNYFGYSSWNYFSYVKLDEIKFHSRLLNATEVMSDYTYNKSYISFV